MKLSKNLICFDTETTGVDCSKDEILSLSIVDYEGNCLFAEMFKPEKATSWPRAQAVNGISPKDVTTCFPLKSHLWRIQDIFNKAEEIIGYNIEFDLGFLTNAGLIVDNNKYLREPMEDFAAIYGEWNDWFQEYKWQKLTTAAEYIGYEWDGEAHGSLADARAALAVAKWLYEGGHYVYE